MFIKRCFRLLLLLWILKFSQQVEGSPVRNETLLNITESIQSAKNITVLTVVTSKIQTTPSVTRVTSSSVSTMTATSVPGKEIKPSSTAGLVPNESNAPTNAFKATNATMPPNTAAMESDNSFLKIIIACVCVVVVLAIIATFCIIKLRRVRRKATESSTYKDRDNQSRQHPMASSGGELQPQSAHVESTEVPVLYSQQRPTAYFNVVAQEDEDGIAKYSTIFRKNESTRRPGMTKEVISAEGGTITTDEITLTFGTGCLSKDTEITMIKDDRNFAFKSLIDLGLVKTAPRVIAFLPDGLEFEKPADLTVCFEQSLDSSELFVLHGTYNSEKERTIWTVVTEEVTVNNDEGYVNMKINGFCFYSYILSTRGRLARILSHLNHSFSCHAVALYRRIPSFETIDVAVVMLSEFVESHEGERNASQVAMLINENGYRVSEKGALKRVDTHRRLEMCLEFPGSDDASPFAFKVDVPQLDTVGMVLDNFRENAQQFPARGKVCLYQVHRNKRSLLWSLNVIEEQEVQATEVEELSCPSNGNEESRVVVMRTTKLSTEEISRLSRVMGVDWDSLAGLMDIPYAEREEVRFNVTKYPDFASKAEVIFAKFNKSKSFCREFLVKCLEELGRHDLGSKISTEATQTKDNEGQKPTHEDQHEPWNNNDNHVVLRQTKLSSREMYRLSRYIVDWESLAGLMDIPRERKEDIRKNAMYLDEKSRAEKILSIFNNRKDFCREKLAGYLKEIGKHDLMTSVQNGLCRCL